MKIGTILFTYHRSSHTRRVLDALSRSEVLPEKIYIFQDGIKESTNHAEWKKVNNLICNIEWCKTEVHVSSENKGLAKSIVSGINYVFQECDAIIVLEDDCVPHRQYMRFMVSALNAYEKEKKIYSVSGYSWDINLPYQKEDAYFNGRICSYGWGTWQDRWMQFEEDYHILSKIKTDPAANMRLHIWGQDLVEMLTGNVLGKCDSWAVFWALKIIEKGGYCVSPYKQLIHNIGFDGSGVHGANVSENVLFWEDENKSSFQFPAQINVTKECEEEFLFLFGGKRGEEKNKQYQDLLIQWIKKKQEGKSMRVPDAWKSDIAVWGKGNIFDCLYNEVIDQLCVKYIIQSRCTVKEYRGIPVIPAEKLPKSIKNIIVIPYFDYDIIVKRVRKIRGDLEFLGIDKCVQNWFL